MGHYVYRYIHPDYPWLYVGKTDVDLEQRIRQHTYSGDNIPREYEYLLNESSIYYIELDNSLQTTYIEKLLIDKYKPFLNRADIIQESSCPIEFSLPKWKKFSFSMLHPSDSGNSSDAIEKKLKTAQKELSKINRVIAKYNDECAKSESINQSFSNFSLEQKKIIICLFEYFIEDLHLVHEVKISKLFSDCDINSDDTPQEEKAKSLMESIYGTGFYVKHFESWVYTR